MESIKPFVKWVGGKRQLIEQFKEYFPKEYNNYYEPFLGAGAVFFHLQHSDCYINDMNSDLITTYKVIKYEVEKLIKLLRTHEKSNSKEYFYKVREWDRLPSYNRRSEAGKAARFIYLNRVGYNGLYRVNLKGQFNVPYGKYVNPKICDEDNLRNISNYLNNNNINITSLDFETAVETATKGDFVYFDPPYDPITKTSSFTQYHKNGFSREEQKRLKLTADRLVDQGVKVILSNSNTEFIKDLYSNKIEDAKGHTNYYFVELVTANRAINSKATHRGPIKEVLIISKD